MSCACGNPLRYGDKLKNGSCRECDDDFNEDLAELAGNDPLAIWTKEEEWDFWNGRGSVTFFITQNIPKHGVFEIEIEKVTGCAYGADEMIGLTDLITEILDFEKLKEGVTYTIEGLTVTWIRGDLYTTDDDAQYDFERLTHKIQWVRFLKQKLTNLWWQNIGWRLRK